MSSFAWTNSQNRRTTDTNKKKLTDEEKEKWKKRKPNGGWGSYTKVSEGSNTSDLMAIIEMMSWELVDKNNVRLLQRRFREYCTFCAERDIAIGNMAAYAALGITSSEASRMAAGKYTRAHKEFIEAVKATCAVFREAKMQKGEINPAIGIWWQKNFDGLRDLPLDEQEDKNLLGDTKTPEQIAASLPELDKPQEDSEESEEETEEENDT